MTPAEFRRRYPDLFFLDPADRSGLSVYLEGLDLLRPGERVVSAELAGEGNMNRTVRAMTSRGSLIVKQARPWVEKFPQFEAPWDRALREAEFYQLTNGIPDVAESMPRLLAADPQARVLVLEDLGAGGDYTGIYSEDSFSSSEVAALGRFLSALHGGFQGEATPPSMANREMRLLNHGHIFQIPLAENNGLDFDSVQSGLEGVAAPLKRDGSFRAVVARLGEEVYLVDGPCLLHGDFFPGSFVRTEKGPRVIDPEFGFFGRPEWDAGVLLAHFWLGQQKEGVREAFLDRYRPPPGFDRELMLQLAGVEIMRRLIGYAQLPLAWPLASRKRLLELARALVLRPASSF